MKRTVLAGIALIAAMGEDASAGPEAEFNLPVIGFVWHSEGRHVRPLSGVPGAAHAGKGQLLGEVENALVPGDGSFAIISSDNSDVQQLQVVRFSASGSEIGVIEGSIASFTNGALSPSGASAVLYSSKCNCIQVIADLRGKPRLLFSASLPQDSDVRAVAVDDQGSLAAVAVRSAGGSRVLVYGGNSESAVAELGLWADALAFDESGERLAIVETAARKLHIATQLAGTPSLEEILSERDELVAPVAVAFAPNSLLLLADAERGVFRWSESDRSVTRVECSCKPATLERAATAGLYRLTNLEGGAVWLLDNRSEEPRTFFVPAPVTELSK